VLAFAFLFAAGCTIAILSVPILATGSHNGKKACPLTAPVESLVHSGGSVKSRPAHAIA
jgi:hypothetical protein